MGLTYYTLLGFGIGGAVYNMMNCSPELYAEKLGLVFKPKNRGYHDRDILKDNEYLKELSTECGLMLLSGAEGFINGFMVPIVIPVKAMISYQNPSEAEKEKHQLKLENETLKQKMESAKYQLMIRSMNDTPEQGKNFDRIFYQSLDNYTPQYAETKIENPKTPQLRYLDESDDDNLISFR